MATIAFATVADLPRLVELLGILFAQEADFIPDANKQERGLRMILESPTSGVILVAREEGEVAGMVTLLFTISTAEGGQACWLEDMVIDPRFRGAGVGSSLLQGAIDFARSKGFCRVTLLTDRDNISAQRFYSRHGFVPSPMTPYRLKWTT